MCGLDLEKMGVGYKDSLLGIALGSASLYFTRQYCVNDVEDNTAHSSMSELETRNRFLFLLDLTQRIVSSILTCLSKYFHRKVTGNRHYFTWRPYLIFVIFYTSKIFGK